jgi:rubredoxin
MPTHIHPRHLTHLRPGDAAAYTPLASHPSQWRCTQCRMLLGVIKDGGLHLRFSRGHEYFASLPAKAICRGCGTLNRKAAPVFAEASQPDAA